MIEGRPSPEAGRDPGSGELIARILLPIVGISYLAAQVALIPADRAPGWDESVYLSQVMPDAHPVFFDAWRARGLPILIAPLAWTGSVEAVRFFLMALSAMAMIAAFWVWVPLIGLAAPLAAFASSFAWLALLNGSEVMPNLWAAILGLAAVGSVARSMESRRSRDQILAGALVCATALVRPTEATVIAGAVAASVLLFQRRTWHVLRPVGLGLVAGWLPWVIEMSVRFGGPVDALREAATGHFGSPRLAVNVHRHLAYTGGDLQGVDVPLGGQVWWGVLLAMGVVAVVRGVRADDRTASILASLGTLALGAEYLVFSPAVAPRFMLPAYAFGSLAAAIGLVSLFRGGVVFRVLAACLLALAVPWAVWQGTVAEQVGARKSEVTSSYRVVGKELRRLARGRPCAFVSPRGYPEIQIESGCEGADIVGSGGPSPSELAQLLRSRSEVAYVVLPRRAAPRFGLRDRLATEIETERSSWFVYLVSTPAP